MALVLLAAGVIGVLLVAADGEGDRQEAAPPTTGPTTTAAPSAADRLRFDRLELDSGFRAHCTPGEGKVWPSFERTRATLPEPGPGGGRLIWFEGVLVGANAGGGRVDETPERLAQVSLVACETERRTVPTETPCTYGMGVGLASSTYLLDRLEVTIALYDARTLQPLGTAPLVNDRCPPYAEQGATDPTLTAEVDDQARTAWIDAHAPEGTFRP